MSHFSQNNFKDSTIGQEGKSNKWLVISTMVIAILLVAVLKRAIGA